MGTHAGDASPSPETSPPDRRGLLGWLSVFGPGAIIASLTIGTGELIFSSRGGAIFGYRILFLFLSISVLKWALVYATARHIVLTGAHPFERWRELNGPRAWLPVIFLVFAVLAIPIWIGFHSTVLGNFLALRTGTSDALGGGAQHLFGLAVLTLVSALALLGGYRLLERVQVAIVVALLGAVTVSLFALKPDWLQLLLGFLPSRLVYPEWLGAHYPKITARSEWSEATLYVGVIGGASYDYLAYVAFLRTKRWGGAGLEIASPALLDEVARDPRHPRRQWLRAVRIDSALSFAAVVVFSAVFVAAGTILLGPDRVVPGNDDFLGPQASFVARLHANLVPLYHAGAFLTLFGTLYGTIEVAPAVVREVLRALARPGAASAAHSDGSRERRRRRGVLVIFCSLAATLLVVQLVRALTGSEPVEATRLLAPANLFTGVLSCGIVAWLAIWSDRRFLPPALRMSVPIATLNTIGGAVFLALGLVAYWSFGRSISDTVGGGLGAFGVLAATLAIGWVVAWLAERASIRRDADAADHGDDGS